ncbi:hypothetical protein DCS_00068 [Drechmeria coniospora]|uniref:Uncharacterized protein n=1 Tax=Drechmeria coniospora TaxID=98403 RepID=A0A151GPF8_DRECN|nr:hypothetical protein DCS_00068 [Drechmeria coniospora]KYK58941.1 hypothetical protein DCS_00068 [Drechmeria coniospora]
MLQGTAIDGNTKRPRRRRPWWLLVLRHSIAGFTFFPAATSARGGTGTGTCVATQVGTGAHVHVQARPRGAPTGTLPAPYPAPYPAREHASTSKYSSAECGAVQAVGALAGTCVVPATVADNAVGSRRAPSLLVSSPVGLQLGLLRKQRPRLRPRTDLPRFGPGSDDKTAPSLDRPVPSTPLNKKSPPPSLNPLASLQPSPLSTSPHDGGADDRCRHRHGRRRALASPHGRRPTDAEASRHGNTDADGDSTERRPTHDESHLDRATLSPRPLPARHPPDLDAAGSPSMMHRR